MPGSGTTTDVGLGRPDPRPTARPPAVPPLRRGRRLGRLRVAGRASPQVGAIVEADDVRRQARLVRMLTDELDRRRALGRRRSTDRRGADRRPARPAASVRHHRGPSRRRCACTGCSATGPSSASTWPSAATDPGPSPPALASRTTERLVLHLADPFDLTVARPPSARRRRALSGDGLVPVGAWSVRARAPRCRWRGVRIRRPRCALLADRPPGDDVDRRRGRRSGGHRRAARRESTSQICLAARVDADPGGRHDARPAHRHRRPRPATRGFELATGDHALIVGPARSGRSTALAVLARSVLGPIRRSADPHRSRPAA